MASTSCTKPIFVKWRRKVSQVREATFQSALRLAITTQYTATKASSSRRLGRTLPTVQYCLWTQHGGNPLNFSKRPESRRALWDGSRGKTQTALSQQKVVQLRTCGFRTPKGSKFNHPPAPQPRHQAIALQSLWWHARHPDIPQRRAKRDAPRAFKWHFLRTSDVAEFAARLMGIHIISLVMPFGWVGAPGEFVAWTMAAQGHHRSFAPPNPEWNDVVPYDSKWLMDDGVVLEPLVGNRLYHSLETLDETMRLTWGPEGVNVEKMAEEGHPSAQQLLWGLYMKNRHLGGEQTSGFH